MNLGIFPTLKNREIIFFHLVNTKITLKSSLYIEKHLKSEMPIPLSFKKLKKSAGSTFSYIRILLYITL